MKSLVLIPFLISSINVFAQELTSEKLEAENPAVSNLIEPGKQIFNTDLLTDGETRYKITMNNDGEIVDKGVLTKQITIDQKSKTVKCIQTIKSDKDLQTDTSVFQLKTLIPVYHAAYHNDEKVFLNFNGLSITGKSVSAKGESNQVDEKTDMIRFDESVYILITSLLPVEKMVRANIPVFSFKGGSEFYTITNIKDEPTFDNGKPGDGVLVIDMKAGHTYSRLFINKLKRTVFKIENNLGGPIVTYELMK